MPFIIGVDEVGRGCWAGPLVAGAVVLDGPIEGLRDSKQLSPAQRARLAAVIEVEAAAAATGWVNATEVDSMGLTAAVAAAMRRAITQLPPAMLEGVDIIIDGNHNFLPELPGARTLVKADDSIPAVSAASIIAKVARDNFMHQLALKHPEYGFDKHVGYGTAQHVAALKQYGPLPDIHRFSYRPVRNAKLK